MLLRHAGGKSVHKIEILLLFTFQHSLRGKKKWKAFYTGVSLILTTPLEAGKGQDHYSCIVEKTLKNTERLDILLKVTHSCWEPAEKKTYT